MLQSPHGVEELFNKYVIDGKVYATDDLLFIVDLVHIFRPKNVKKIKRVSIDALVSYLKTHDTERAAISVYLKELLSNRYFSRMVSDAGILQDSEFFSEVKKRLWAKVLPYQPEKGTYEYVLNQVFYKHTDAEWVDMIPVEQLLELFGLLEFNDLFVSNKEGTVLNELLNSIDIITQRMSGRAMESYIINMVPEYSHLESPFRALEIEFSSVLEAFLNDEIKVLHESDMSYKQILILHKQCQEFVNQAFKNSSKYGISIKVNQSLLRLRQQLQRVYVLISLLVVKEDVVVERQTNTIELARRLVKYNCYKYNVTGLIKESTQLISYEITQHTAKTGEHYITNSPREYWHMFRGSMGAGIVVGFLCIFKVFAHHADVSNFGEAMLYSLNYAFGFCLIYLLGFTLATKQPAMTAATIIKAIEDGRKQHIDSDDKHLGFAKLFARLFRSQFIAFVGNVILAFPVALFLIWGIDQLFGVNIVGTQEEWTKMLVDTDPFASRALFHAGIAGIFLFLSGIISGNVSNRNKHNKVLYRIQEHPWLKRNLGPKRTAKLANWVDTKWPGMVSNVWFGVFMGTCGTIGAFLGLGIDIRHITFVSGNIALGLYGSGFAAPVEMLVWAFIGMWMIGFMNFMVSFSLSLLLAFRSRNIPFKETKDLARVTWRHFKSFPMEFFLPTSSGVVENPNNLTGKSDTDIQKDKK
ncbi:recombinase [Myroides sp. BIT-d1]|uniref:Recombinase n=1 Tax=Myroides albus TaxID=2562892 RepID=A0A6I3LNK6_9FLAO|nr:recombinase [Myroides albus]MTG97565.1 recombinase [Myroides albus]